ncbi:copper homeostasis membrane protein CopD [Tatumella sp. UCD-D_suzukii]|uniref:copper homeostasis membrane protein CopD n=1 Tax=Tatumella sp. UCD-D_suzukii TaxID=1408192 RepID=UPI0006880069|nr:copper homeostasis membrane protein CopD [Tatumella sp. UCD-D_suzukii]
MTDFLYISLRFFHFSSLFLLTGCLMYLMLLTPAGYRNRLWNRLSSALRVSAVTALFSAIALFALQTIMMSGDTAAIRQPELWVAVAGTRFGHAWLPEMTFAAVSFMLLRVGGETVRYPLLLSQLLQLFLTAMTGHAAMHDGWRGVAGEASQSLHVIAAAFWCGGLYPLRVLIKQGQRDPKDNTAILTMMKFSRSGHWAVALVLLTGLCNTLLIAGIPRHFSFWLSGVILKSVLVAGMVTLALLNRYWLVPRFRQFPTESRRMFIRLTQAEILLATGAIAVVSLFATLSPD